MDEGKYEGATTKDVIVRMVAIALADEDDIDVPVRWLLSMGRVGVKQVERPAEESLLCMSRKSGQSLTVWDSAWVLQIP